MNYIAKVVAIRTKPFGLLSRSCRGVHKYVLDSYVICDRYSYKKYDKTIDPPLCIDCKHFVPLYLSPHFPEPACIRFDKVVTCRSARNCEKMCGYEGYYFDPICDSDV